jgi:hypothetical protein
VIVDNLYILGTCGRPAEADAELVIYADPIQTRPGAFQGFKAVTGWDTEVINPPGDLQLPQFASSYGLDLLKSLDPSSFGKRFSIRIPERRDHPQ